MLVLTSLLQSLLYGTPNKDAVYLAIIGAHDRCVGLGVSQSDFYFVVDVVCQEYEKQRKANPISSMF